MKLLPLILAASMVAPMAHAKGFKHNPSNGYCPPGLAKKSPRCIPPGQVNKFALGDFLPDGEFDFVLNPFDFHLPGLGEGEGYVQIGDAFVKVNRETFEILNLFDALGQVLN